MAGPRTAGVDETFDLARDVTTSPQRVEVSRDLARRRWREGPGKTVLHFALLVAAAAAIYFSCEWFVNAVEWVGRRLQVREMAVGTVLAAAGTALPESVVTLVAVAFGGTPQHKDIGVGAAMGGPLALATVAYGITGLVMLTQRTKVSVPLKPRSWEPRPWEPRSRDPGSQDLGDTAKLARDQAWFLGIFVVKVALGLVAFAYKPWLGLLFFAAYAMYFWREMRGAGDHHSGELEPLRLQRHREKPSGWAIAAQTVGALAVIFAASQLFVHQLQAVGPMLGLPAAVTALLLSPIATELPETMNAIIWVRNGKTPLALANISGAMMIQATVPSGLGILFTPWLLGPPLLLAGVATMAAVGYLLVLLKSRRLTATTLMFAAAWYALFAAFLLG